MDYRGNIGNRPAGRFYGISRCGRNDPPYPGSRLSLGNLQAGDRQRGPTAPGHFGAIFRKYCHAVMINENIAFNIERQRSRQMKIGKFNERALIGGQYPWRYSWPETFSWAGSVVWGQRSRSKIHWTAPIPSAIRWSLSRRLSRPIFEVVESGPVLQNTILN